MPRNKSDFRVLGAVLGASLVRVERQIFRPDFDYYAESIRDQESDGPIQFTLDSGLIFYVAANTERMSVDVSAGPMPKLGSTFFAREVGHNDFWAPRMRKTVLGVHALVSDWQPPGAAPFGLEFHLDVSEPFVIEYVSDEQHLDQIRVTGSLTDPATLKFPVATLTKS